MKTPTSSAFNYIWSAGLGAMIALLIFIVYSSYLLGKDLEQLSMSVDQMVENSLEMERMVNELENEAQVLHPSGDE